MIAVAESHAPEGIPNTQTEAVRFRSPWETEGEYRVRLVLDAALSEWRAEGRIAPQTSMNMALQIVEACAQDTQAIWSALSLLEQMQRSKVISPELLFYFRDELKRLR